MKTLGVVAAIAIFESISFAQAGRMQDPPAPSREPAPGVERVAPAPPTWCAGHPPKSWGSPITVVADDLRASGYTRDVLRQLGELACDRPDDPTRQRWIAYYRQGWMNFVGTTEREDREAIAARLLPKADQDRATAEVCRPLFNARGAPREVAFRRATARALGCGALPYELHGTSDLGELLWWYDKSAAPPSELVRVTLVLQCLNGAKDTNTLVDPSRAGAYALCGHDARALDRAAFERDLAAAHPGPIGVAGARENFAYASRVAAAYQAAWKAKAAEDPAYRAVVFDAPEAGFASWVKTYEANQAAIDLAWSFEDKFREGVKSAFDACGATLRPKLKAHVAARRPKTRDEIAEALADDVGAPLVSALIACDAMEGRYGLAAVEARLPGGRARRGPRAAAYWSALDALTGIVKDQTRFALQPSQFGAPLPAIRQDHSMVHQAYVSTFNRASFDRDEQGQVASVAPQGEGVMVGFKTVASKEAVYDCKPTNRVRSILPDGRLDYYENCVYQRTVIVKSTPQPAWVRRELADGIRPGVTLKLRVDNKPKPREGFPLEVFADAELKRPLAFYGLAVR